MSAISIKSYFVIVIIKVDRGWVTCLCEGVKYILYIRDFSFDNHYKVCKGNENIISRRHPPCYKVSISIRRIGMSMIVVMWMAPSDEGLINSFN